MKGNYEVECCTGVGNYKLTLQGGTTIWSEESPSEILFGTEAKLQKLEVVGVEQRPEHKTYIHLRDGGKLVKYEVEGMLTHNAAKRLLKEAGYDVRGLRFVLEYEQIV